MPASRPGAGPLGRALQTVIKKVTVAAGVFAPGHLGELTRHVPFELVDAVLDETGTTQRRLRDLPSRVGVYFVLALGLFPKQGHSKVWDKLVAALAGLPFRPRQARPCGTCAAAWARPRSSRCSRRWPARSRSRARRACGSAD